MNTIIGAYIDQVQTGFIPKRDLVDNTRKIINLIHYSKSNNIKSFLFLSLDLEKAFDSVEIPYLKELIKQINFGDKFSNASDSLYTSPKAQVQVIEMYSQEFPVSKDTRQGCPLSPLFALAIEP